MHIQWHGNYCVRIQSGDTSLLVDPYSPPTGLPSLRGVVQVVALSNPSDPTMSYTTGLPGEPVIIDTPGEYEVANFSLHAFGWHSSAGSERSLQRWNIEGMTVLHLGALDRELTDKELQELEKTDSDIVLLPIGGGTSLNVQQALHMVTTLEPRIVIPIHYAIAHLKEKLDTLDRFTKEMGVTAQPEKKLTVKANKLPQNELTTIILSPV